MYLPPEIILNICDHFNLDPASEPNDRDCLRNLRLVNHNFNNTLSQVLFSDFSLKYGVLRSVPQMNAVADAGALKGRLKRLFICSESYFPLAKDVSFHCRDRYSWSRGPTTVWPINFPGGIPARKGAKGRRSHNPQDIMLHWHFREFPTKPWIKFSMKRQEFVKQHDEYEAAFERFIENIDGVDELEIALGAGWTSERMDDWTRIISSRLILKLDEWTVSKLVVKIPAMKFASQVFIGIDQIKRLERLKSFSIVAGYDPHRSASSFIGYNVSHFFGRVPNLEEFSFTLSHPIKSQHVVPFFPTPDVGKNLKSMIFSHLFLRYGYTAFIFVLETCGANLEYLELSTVILDLPGLADGQPMNYQEPFEQDWGHIFECISKSLPKLLDLKLKLLLYGRDLEYWRWSQGSRGVLISMPFYYDREFLNGTNWWRILKNVTIVTQYASDWRAMMKLKGEVAKRRKDRMLGISENLEAMHIEDWGGQPTSGWKFVIDRDPREDIY